mgnify:CR=1 FL=1
MRVRDALRAAVARLRAAGVEDPARDARVLMAHALGIAPPRLVGAIGEAMTGTQTAAFETAIAAREKRQPVAQITGERAFWGFPFRVTPDTLAPRPETELLVAEALRMPFARMLDLGTGSGCILIACLLETGAARGTGLDVSVAALAVAGENAARLGVADRADFVQRNWRDPEWSAGLGRFDVIVSNPPYIALGEMAALSPEVRDWEPHLALTPGGDGMDAYRAIACDVMSLLLPGGRILVETGPTQGPAVAGLFAAAGLISARILPDFDGRDRVVVAEAPGAGAGRGL